MDNSEIIAATLGDAKRRPFFSTWCLRLSGRKAQSSRHASVLLEVHGHTCDVT